MTRRKHNGYSFFLLIISVTLLIGQCLFSAPITVSAGGTGSEITATGLTGSDATVTSQSNVIINDPTSLTIWDRVYTSYDWSIADDVKMVAGDYATVTLPDGMQFPDDTTFSVYNTAGGEPIGTFTAAKDASTGQIVFSDYLREHPADRKGTLEFVTIGKQITSSSTSGDTDHIRKSGWLIDESRNDLGRQTQAQWQVLINPNRETLTNVVVTDTIDTTNQELDNDATKGRPRLVYASDNTTPVDPADYTLTTTGDTITVTFKTDVTKPLNLLYTTTITNSAYLNSGASVDLLNQFSMMGNVKGNPGDPGGGGSVPVEETNGQYRNQASVVAGGSGSGGGDVGRTTISGKKTWVDNNNQDGLRPDAIKVGLFNGKQKVAEQTVTAADNWQYSFPDEPKTSDGNDINYTVKELDVPAGYTATVDGNNITNTHKPTALIISKQGVNDKALAGAEFALYKYDATAADHRGALVKDKLTTAADGQVQLDHLDWAQQYLIVETKAPKGYVLPTDGSEQQLVEFKPEGTLAYRATATFRDKLKPITVRLNKTDKWFGKQLQGAEFTLFDSKGTQIGQPVTTTAPTDQEWNFAFSGLEAGATYTIKETKAPAGYDVMYKAYTLTVAADGQSVTLTPVVAAGQTADTQKIDVTFEDGTTQNLAGVLQVENTPSTILPHTGGKGTSFRLICALAMLSMAALLSAWVWMRRREVFDHD